MFPPWGPLSIVLIDSSSGAVPIVPTIGLDRDPRSLVPDDLAVLHVDHSRVDAEVPRRIQSLNGPMPGTSAVKPGRHELHLLHAAHQHVCGRGAVDGDRPGHRVDERKLQHARVELVVRRVQDVADVELGLDPHASPGRDRRHGRVLGAQGVADLALRDLEEVAAGGHACPGSVRSASGGISSPMSANA